MKINYFSSFSNLFKTSRVTSTAFCLTASAALSKTGVLKKQNETTTVIKATMKTDFKIITLKLTDYTDSMYAKIFLNNEEELKRLLGILKNNKWFKFSGYTKHDQYLNDEIVFNVESINISNYKKEEVRDRNR